MQFINFVNRCFVHDRQIMHTILSQMANFEMILAWQAWLGLIFHARRGGGGSTLNRNSILEMTSRWIEPRIPGIVKLMVHRQNALRIKRPRNKTSFKTSEDKMFHGQNVLRDKTFHGTIRPRGQNSRINVYVKRPKSMIYSAVYLKMI